MQPQSPNETNPESTPVDQVAPQVVVPTEPAAPLPSEPASSVAPVSTPEPVQPVVASPDVVAPVGVSPMQTGTTDPTIPVTPGMTPTPIPQGVTPAKKFGGGMAGKTKMIVGVLVALFVVGTLAVAGMRMLGRSVKYGELKSYSSKDASKGQGFAFEYPEQMEEKDSSSSSVKLVDYVLAKKDGDMNATVSVETESLGSAAVAAEVAKQMKDHESEVYKAFKTEAQNVFKKQSDISDFKLNDGQPFTNDNIANGTMFDFTYLAKSSDGEDQIPIKGKVLIAIGGDRGYILAIEAREEVWDRNVAVFDKVFATFKIEQ